MDKRPAGRYPLLLDYESTRPDTLSQTEHEDTWEHDDELRAVLTDARGALAQYSELLASVAGVPPLSR